jgi:phage tail sheath protein FI
MAVTPTYPGVYIQELPSPVHTITGVATSITAFIGYTGRGIDNRAEMVLSFSDFERAFGGIEKDSELSYAVQQFFTNGGSQAYVVRVPHHGATGASVTFAGLTFTALSSGSWANGELLIAVDLNNVAASEPTSFNLTIANLDDGTVETFSSVSLNPAKSSYVVAVVNDPDTGSQLVNVTAGTLSTTAPPKVTGILGASTLISQVNASLSGTALAGTAALTANSNAVTGTGTSFTTALKVGQTVAFGSDPTMTPYTIQAIGSNTSLTLSSSYSGPVQPSTSITLVSATASQDFGLRLGFAGAPLPGTAALVPNSASVTGTGTNFTTSLAVGRFIVFSTDASLTPYRVAAIASDTGLTLAPPYTGPAETLADISVLPAVSSPLPLDIKVFSSGGPIPQTLAGLASQIQNTLNAALSVKWPGATVRCDVGTPSTTTQSVRVTASLPGLPDTVIAFGTPASSLADASAILHLAAPASVNVAQYALGTGNAGVQGQTASVAGTDGSGLPQTGDLIGDPLTFKGIYALDKVDLFNLMSIPDATRATPGNPNSIDPNVDPNAIYAAAISYCKKRRAMLLIDPPPAVSTVAAAVDWKTMGLAVNDENGAAFFPRFRLPDPANNYQLRTFAPSGLIAGLYARIDGSRGVWKAPAGTEATLTGVQGLVYKLTDAENGVINPLGLNCARLFPIYGPVMWGARTLVGADAAASQWKYVPVRRTALFIEESLYRGTQWAVFEPNDEPLWAQLRLNVGSFMHDLFRKGAFQGQTPQDAYLVKCDNETTTPSDINNGIVNILVAFAPLQPAEFVVIQIQQLAGAVQT